MLEHDVSVVMRERTLMVMTMVEVKVMVLIMMCHVQRRQRQRYRVMRPSGILVTQWRFRPGQWIVFVRDH